MNRRIAVQTAPCLATGFGFVFVLASLTAAKRIMPKIKRLGGLSCDSPLAIESRQSMEMADGNGQGVGGVRGFGRSGKLEQPDYHVLDLLLFSAPVADYRGLDSKRRVFSDFEAGRGSSQHGYAANLAEFESGLHVEGIEHVFDGDFIRLMLGDDGSQVHVDARQAT